MLRSAFSEESRQPLHGSNREQSRRGRLLSRVISIARDCWLKSFARETFHGATKNEMKSGCLLNNAERECCEPCCVVAERDEETHRPAAGAGYARGDDVASAFAPSRELRERNGLGAARQRRGSSLYARRNVALTILIMSFWSAPMCWAVPSESSFLCSGSHTSVAFDPSRVIPGHRSHKSYSSGSGGAGDAGRRPAKPRHAPSCTMYARCTREYP